MSDWFGSVWENLRYPLVIVNILLFFVIKKVMPANNDVAQEVGQPRKKILLVIAHPDDEVMFFYPLLKQIIKVHDVRILCMSIGNADGIGETRKKEMSHLVEHLGLDVSNLTMIDHRLLQDGMHVQWDVQTIADLVYSNLADASVVVTFDNQGVSGHPNHIAVHHGVRMMLDQHKSELPAEFKALQLESTNIIRKYLGPLDFPLSSLASYFFVNSSPPDCYRAMRCHHSQFVWYRRLFVIFSRYAYYNTLTTIDFRS